MHEIICKLMDEMSGIHAIDYEVSGDGKKLKRVELAPSALDMPAIFQNDNRYGLLLPRNGVSYGYIILNKDVELTNREVRKMVTRGLLRWYLELQFKFHRVTHKADADLVYEFRSENDDPLLTPGTIAYMYYPLGGTHDGICVINVRPYFTLHGNGIDMHWIDPINYPVLGMGVTGATVDGDQVLGHEDGHGLLGLPHISGIMASNYGSMTEHLSELDILRGSNKIPKRNWSSRKYQRLKNWLFHASER